MGDFFVIAPCLVTLSLASVLQGVQGNTTVVRNREERETAPTAKENTVGHLELCCITGTLCAGNMACIACLCRCPLNYDYKSNTGLCEASFTTTSTPTPINDDSNGTISDGSLPGGACADSSACVEGLVCVQYKCQCPRPCVYLPEHLSCDCGAAEDVVWPSVVGVLVGIVIVAFWGMCITSSVKSHREERNKVMQLSQQQQQQQQPVPRISTLGAVYGTAHLTVPTPSASSAPTATPSPITTPKPLRLSRQSVAPTPPSQPVFRPASPPSSTYHYNPSSSSTFLTPPENPFQEDHYPSSSSSSSKPLPSSASAPEDRQQPLNQEGLDGLSPTWSDPPRSVRF